MNRSLVPYTDRDKSFRYFHCRRCGCVTHYERFNVRSDDRLAVNAQ